MDWQCPQCNEMVPGSAVNCERCGYTRIPSLLLYGPSGLTFCTRIEFKVDRAVYKDLGSDYQYFSLLPNKYQFMLVRDGSLPRGWGIVTPKAADYVTLLDDAPCVEEKVYPLLQGSVIKVQSRKNPDKTAAPIQVGFEET